LHQETRTPAEFEEGFRSYGAKGSGWAGKKDERLKPTISPATLDEVARLEKEIKLAPSPCREESSSR